VVPFRGREYQQPPPGCKQEYLGKIFSILFRAAVAACYLLGMFAKNKRRVDGSTRRRENLA